jgi:uncharacterized membrane protein
MENSLSTRANASYTCLKTVGRLVLPIMKAEFAMLLSLLPRRRCGGDLRPDRILSGGACCTRAGNATAAMRPRGPTAGMGEYEPGGEPGGGFRGAGVSGTNLRCVRSE